MVELCLLILMLSILIPILMVIVQTVFQVVIVGIEILVFAVGRVHSVIVAIVRAVTRL
jgi:hypothetical protein